MRERETSLNNTIPLTKCNKCNYNKQTLFRINRSIINALSAVQRDTNTV